MKLKIISAGAGSGKTYRLTGEMVGMLQQRTAEGRALVRASGIIATTFTNMAAAELRERVRVRLLESSLNKEANDLANALIGTVHSLGVSLLKRFAYEAGVSPEVDILAEEDRQILFNQSLATVLTLDRVENMEHLVNRLGLNKRGDYDWRKPVRELTEMVQLNNFSAGILEKSKQQSVEQFLAFLPAAGNLSRETLHAGLKEKLQVTIDLLEQGGDETQKTKSVINDLRILLQELINRGELYWHQWVKIAKMEAGAKSRDHLGALQEFALSHESCPDFQGDICAFIWQIFDLAGDAISEFREYKKRRGLIDFADMEALVNELLDHPQVMAVLEDELDLLLVDEFQDTSPMQLEIFLKLSKLAKYSVWVGDPKQSIYGFRGAEPALMQAIIDHAGGILPENIQEYSWRAREDLVWVSNAIFTRAFSNLPPEQVRLLPKRTASQEPPEMGDAIIHWHFIPDTEGKRMPGSPWFENCIAETLRVELERGIWILPKGEKEHRKARPGDCAILCRRNKDAEIVAEALHRAGLKVATARTGLLKTAESKLVLACCKYMLNRHDSLSVAEILVLAAGMSTEEMIDHRLEYLDRERQTEQAERWAEEIPIIRQLNILRSQVVELSSAELLGLLLDELDLRRIVASWGRTSRRLDNIEVLCRLSLQYEEACNRLHTAASLGGFLLWVNELESKGEDLQAEGEGTDAVNVLTYHKSKGLEWPVVICHNLEGELRSDVWGFQIIAESSEIRLDELLGNRWLRFWVNPYADQLQKTPLSQRLADSDVQIAKTQQAREEEVRLLYVGLTRARDYLIFPSRKNKSTAWLNRVWNGQNEHDTLDPNISESPWEWEGKGIPLRTLTEVMPVDFPVTSQAEESITYFEPWSGKQQHQPYHIALEKEKLSDTYTIKIGEVTQYAAPLKMEENGETYRVAKSLKAFLVADHREYSPASRLDMAQGIVARFELGEIIDPMDVVRQSDAFQKQLSVIAAGGSVYRKYPVRYEHQGRLFETTFDFLMDTADVLVMVQHSGYPATDSRSLHRKVTELSDWLYLSHRALSALFRKPVACYIHFVLSGNMVPVKVV